MTMTGTDSEKPKRIDVARERAEAANCVIADLTRNGLPKEIAHDLLIAYAKAIEGHCREENGARKVMIQAGCLPGTLNKYRDAKMVEIRMGP